MAYLQNKDDYYYHKTGFRLAKYDDDGTLKKKGYTDCSHLMYELCGKVGSYTARYRYSGYKGPKGSLFVEGSNYSEFTLELIEGMEVYTKNKKHVGMLLLWDFGDGPEWAVFQSASTSVKNSKAYFEDDTGPNVTALFREDGTSQWVWFTYPRFVDYRTLVGK